MPEPGADPNLVRQPDRDERKLFATTFPVVH